MHNLLNQILWHWIDMKLNFFVMLMPFLGTSIKLVQYHCYFSHLALDFFIHFTTNFIWVTYWISLATPTLHHWRPPFCLSPYNFLSSNISSSSFHILRSLWVCACFSHGCFSVFDQPPFPFPLSGPSLISCSTLASVFFKQLVFSWAPTSNIHFKRTETHVRKKKKSPRVLFAQHCHTLPPPFFSLSSPLSVPPHPNCCLFIIIGAF